MIPLYLSLSGIYSYREAQHIDFSKLTSTHLFGIFGAVGSGKSALLEAIVFALYGESERLNNKEQRGYNMMNLKSNEALIEFDFEAPGNKGQFRAIARGRRNSKNKEDVKFERSLYRVDGSKLIPVETSEITSIIGISYDNFKMTIIVPQGKFQKFLHLTSTERSEMVKELFGLQRFDLSFKTGLLQKKNDEVISNCQGKLQQLGEVSEEIINHLRNEILILSQELADLTTHIESKSKLEAEYKLIREQHVSLETNRKTLAELELKLPEMKLAEQQLNDFDECVSNFKSDLELLDEKKRQLATDTNELEKSSLKLEELKQKVLSAGTQLEAAKKLFESRDTLLQTAREYESAAEINEALKEFNSLQERIKTGEGKLEDVSKSLLALKAETVELDKLRETLRQQAPDFMKLQQLKDWFSAGKILSEKKQNQEEAGAKLQILSGEIEGKIEEIARISGVPTPDNKMEISSLQTEIKTKLDSVKLSYSDASHKLLNLEVKEKIQAYSENLQDGEPCPLCGSKDHPGAHNQESSLPELEAARQQKSDLENRIKQLETALTSAKILEESILRFKSESELLQKSLKEAELALSAHLSTNPQPGFREEQLNSDLQKYSKIQEELQNLEKKFGEISVSSNEQNELHRKYTEHLTNLQLSQGKAGEKISTLKSRMQILAEKDYAGITSEALTEKAAQLKDQHRIAGEDFEKYEKIHRDLQSEMQNLSGSTERLKLSIASLTAAIEETRKQLDVRITASRFGNEAAIREILLLKFDRMAEQQRLRAFHESMASVQTAIKQLEIQLKDKFYDSASHELIIREIAALKEQNDQKLQLKGAKEQSLLRMTQDFAEAGKLLVLLKKLETRKDNLKTLSDMFRSQGFVNYVSTIYLQNLVTAANERFYRLTRQQLKLELDPSNNFRIRDYLNEGQWRNVKTLSGGQTFQASLCLALALADNVQQLNQGGQNFFFLDEGFGTLDRESLELVMNTLKSLRKENRIVGVISHVEEMQQEISSWVRIQRDEEKGSLVTNSWE
ncbi:MAG: SMC family ATPase [Bacteroidales bacterium]|nr:SMC family ATPase [Bacteroidales bacterium]